ncbi:hypothetical protein [Polynucleobacter sp. HIN10]|jgi:hypothetical protein|uniref:hypothetical protein n=1 Tax=Polynucleobacter sp. HIN10 TaxID=3047869 RepID=UPI00257424AA|nr:hypothetical protein [Polynucleobacter sp. HIN10]BEI42165.1 hypothetical protein PHIN10_03140 [Polynucleobacter sp. HIN10]
MKIKVLITSLLLSVFGFAHAGPGHELKPAHGGVIVEAKDIDVELVAKSDILAIYLSDHGKPLSSEGGNAKLTILNGSDKKEYELLPVGGRFELKGAFSVPKGSKAIAVIRLKSKVITARFNL